MEHQHTLKQTILTLAELLTDQSHLCEQLEQEKQDVLHDMAALQEDCHRAETDLLSSQSALNFQREVNSDLRADLKDMEARVRLGTPTNQEVREAETCKVQRDLLLSLFQRPEVLRLLVNYMHTSGQTMWDMLDDCRDIIPRRSTSSKMYDKSHSGASSTPRTSWSPTIGHLRWA